MRAPKRVPALRSDQEAEKFLMQDLSNLDFAQFRPFRPVAEPPREDGVRRSAVNPKKTEPDRR